MKCPNCGYDKIQPNFNFCPSCKRLLNEKVGVVKISHMSQQKQKETILNESVKEIVAVEVLSEAETLENIQHQFENVLMGYISPPKEAEESIRKGEEGKILVEDMANIAKRNLEKLMEQMLEYTHKNRCTKNEQ